MNRVDINPHYFWYKTKMTFCFCLVFLNCGRTFRNLFFVNGNRHFLHFFFSPFFNCWFFKENYLV